MSATPKTGTYSASQISTLIGLNPFATPLHGFQVMKEAAEPGWNAAHGYTLPPAPDNAAIRWGLAFEEAIIKLAEGREGCEITHREKLFKYYDTEGIVLSCHIDGRFSSGFHIHPVIHEGKTTNHWAYKSTKKEILEAISTNGQLLPGYQVTRKWGEPGTNEVPQEYQVQAAVQRICTGAELVKLSVLVFPRPQQEYEDLGWEIINTTTRDVFFIGKKSSDSEFTWKEKLCPMDWARPWAQQGHFHTYNLPTSPVLEQEIIKAMQRFHENNFLPGIPPDSQTFDDVRRVMPNPLGTVIATPELITLCKEYSENARQLGTASPIRARQEILKTRISDLAKALRRTSATNPLDKFLILDPDGGDTLATVGKNKNGVISFRAARAK
jgi:hypothetical protein